MQQSSGLIGEALSSVCAFHIRIMLYSPSDPPRWGSISKDLSSGGLFEVGGTTAVRNIASWTRPCRTSQHELQM